MAQRATSLALVLASVQAVAGCAPVLPAYTVSVPPRVLDVRPRRSVVFARTAVSLDPLRAALDEALPAKIEGGGERALGPFGRGEARWSLGRQPAELTAASDGLGLKLAELGLVTVAVGPLHCRSERAGFVLEAHGRPALTPSGELELAEPRVVLTPVAPFECGKLPLPVGALLEKAAAPLASGLRLALAAVRLPLGPLFDRALDELATPRAVEIEGRPACLDVDPEALVLAPVGGQGGTMTLRAGVDVAPRLSLGPCPEKTAPRARGPVRVREVALDERFEIEVAVALLDEELARRVRAELVGKRFGDGRRAIVVRSVALADASGRLLARVDVTGAFAGTLYLWGTPAIVDRGGRYFVEIPDLHAAAETRSLVDRVAWWLWKLRAGGLEADLRRRISFEITGRLTVARAALTRAWPLGATGWTLRTTLERIVPGDVASRPGWLSVEARLIGHAELER